MEINTNNDKLANELTIGELKGIISQIVKETMEEVIENMTALSSEAYINSIKEAREDYKAGRFIKLADEVYI
jgi:hypothetical protein